MRSTVIKRLQALVIDWLTICGYLIALGIVAFLLYLVLWDNMPSLSAVQMQLLVTMITVVPVTIWYTVKESGPPFGSLGKNEMGLRVEYRDDPVRAALIRNVLKFLPWQIAHLGVIDGYYSSFESPFAMVVILIGLFLALTYVMQVVFTPSHRHFPDIVSGSRVVRMPGEDS